MLSIDSSSPVLPLIVALAGLAAACSSTTSAAPESKVEREPDPTVEPTQVAEVTTGTWTDCARLAIDDEHRVEQEQLIETSGLAASTRYNDVLWAHNDGGSATGVHALDLDGTDRGFFSLSGIDGFDMEDMALVDGRIHLADIGDNDRQRETVQLYSFDEPDLADNSPGSEGTIDPAAVTTTDLRYPDEPTDAEALLVDPLSDEVVILSKDLEAGNAATRIYSFTMPPPSGSDSNSGDSDSGDSDGTATIEMELVGSIDVAELESRATDLSLTAVLFPGLLTAADISDDGRLIAVRTYATVWLYPRAEGQTMAEALQGQPCEGGTAAESQGEAVALLPGNDQRDEEGVIHYVTASEGTNPVIHLVSVQLQ